MKQYISNIINSIVMAAVAAGMIAGCSERIDVPVGDGDTYVNFRFALIDDATTAAGTRATDYDEFKPGKSRENVNQLRVIVVNSNHIVEVNQMVTPNAGGVYETGPRKMLGNDRKQVFAFANCEKLVLRDSVGGILAERAELVFDELTEGSFASTHYVNNFIYNSVLFFDDYFDTTTGALKSSVGDGSKPYEWLPLTATKSVSVGTGGTEAAPEVCDVDMYRAAAKYTYRIVNKTNYAHNFNLRTSINHVADRQYLMPHATVLDAHGTILDYNNPTTMAPVNEADTIYRYYNQINVPRSDNPDTKPEVVVLDSDQYAPFYLFEGAQHQSEQPYATQISIYDIESGWQPLSCLMPTDAGLVENPEGWMLDLPRNTHVVINIIINPHKVDVTVQMVPYDEVDLDPSFGINSGGNWIPIIDDNGTLINWYDPVNGLYYSPDKSTVINGAYNIIDPATGYYIIRSDTDDSILYYFDAKKGRYYNVYDTPDGRVYEEFDIVTLWIINRNSDEQITHYTATIKRNADGTPHTRINVRSKERDPGTGWYLVKDMDDGNVLKYYYNAAQSVRKYYDLNKHEVN